MEKGFSCPIIFRIRIFCWRCYLYDCFACLSLFNHQINKNEKEFDFKENIDFCKCLLFRISMFLGNALFPAFGYKKAFE